MKKLFLSIIFLACTSILPENAIVNVNNLRVRTHPNVNSKIKAYLSENDFVVTLDKSSNTNTFVLRKKKKTDYWYRIRASSGIEGWVFGGAIKLKSVKKKKSIKMPEINAIGLAKIWRFSDVKNPNNSTWSLPPWKKVKIIQGSFSLSNPRKNGKITLIPMKGHIPSFNSKIVKTQENSDELRGVKYWMVDIEQIIHPGWYKIRGDLSRVSEYPSDLFIIYPSVKYAKVLNSKFISKGELPKGIYKELITTAIDLTGNYLPDIIRYTFHCKNPANLNKNNWDLICSNVYLRKNKKWKLIQQ